MKELLKRLLGPKWQARAHRLSRLRWVTKAKNVRSFAGPAPPHRRLAYVLIDPETESYSYDVANEREIVAGLSTALGYPLRQLAAYASETRLDPELNERLNRHVRWRFDVKGRLPLGHRLAWYVMARALKPRLVVETGIYLGLGSLALLRALERNRQEGFSGELMSFDNDPRAGRVVRDPLRRDWRRHVGLTGELLLPALDGRRVDLLFQDTPHTEENQRFEFTAALSHAAPHLVLVDGSGWAPTLEQMSLERSGAYHRLQVRSRDHVYPGIEVRFSVFDSRHALAPSGDALVDVPDTAAAA